MTPDNALLQLRDIQLPLTESTISALPPWLLPGCAALLVIAIWVWRKRRRAMNWQRQTTTELDAIVRTVRDGDIEHGWQRLSLVLRQLALLHSNPSHSNQSQDGKGTPASHTGQQWLKLLDQLFDTDAFTGPDGQALLQGPYKPPLHASESRSDPALLRLTTLVRDGLPALNSSGSA